MAGGLLNVLNGAVVLLVGIGVSERHGNGMGGVALHMGGKVQKFLPVQFLGMDSSDFEDAFRKGACLVKDHGFQFGQGVQKVGALDEDTLSGGSAKASEEGQRHGDDKCAGA